MADLRFLLSQDLSDHLSGYDQGDGLWETRAKGSMFLDHGTLQLGGLIARYVISILLISGRGRLSSLHTNDIHWMISYRIYILLGTSSLLFPDM